MKLKVYAVRYREDITPFLESYYSDTTIDHSNTFLTIINNYGELNCEDSRVIILNNVLRPDFSTGHLARNWNQALINGFKDLNNPDCDVIVCVQIDALFTDKWYSTVKDIFETNKYDYFSVGRGDEFQYFTPKAVKNIGLYDERYCNIQHHEGDYLLRVLLQSFKNKDLKVSINDVWHRRTYNVDEKITTVIKPSVTCPNEAQNASVKYHDVSVRVFYYKWKNIHPMYWNAENLLSLLNCSAIDLKKEFKYYPYFEKDINSDIYLLE